MKKKLLILSFVFALGMVLLSILLLYKIEVSEPQDSYSLLAIDANEIAQLIENGEYDTALKKTREFEKKSYEMSDTSDAKKAIVFMCAAGLCYMICILGYIWFSILRPFDIMKDFAFKISQGNFDVPLDYERSNYFGEFTWAFDCMRKEITKARSSEREAIENNKTVIATLSHDIKTPIASIRAYAEGLEANMDSTPEKKARYMQVIMRKCDEVAKLTNDLFLHSLSDLNKLQMSMESVEIVSYLKFGIEEIVGGGQDVHLSVPKFSQVITIDKNRFLQVLENLINNARKYAKTKIDITCVKEKDGIEISVRDYGTGIPDEDMPFIFDKFYRGKNHGNEQGSGLGLYIVKYIVEQMNGQVRLENSPQGLKVVLFFSI